jgi:aspartate aminotransferase-like enzyme
MEAVIVNTAHPGSRVLVVEGGKFGRRWGQIATALGCEVDTLNFPMGAEAAPEVIAERVGAAAPDILALTHVESSSGLRLDLEAVLNSLPGRRPLIALDAVASVGSERLMMDEWGIDVIAGAGQKGLAAPAGISFIIAGEKAMKAASENPRPGFYFSFARYEEGMSTGDTPFTPAVHSVQLLHGSLERIRSVGSGEVFARHEAASSALISAAGRAGFRSLPEMPSNSVQAFLPPEGISCEAVIRDLGENHGIMIAGGQDEMAGKIVRTGFPGIYSGDTLARLVRGLAAAAGTDGEDVLSFLEPVRGLEPLFGSPLT